MLKKTIDHIMVGLAIAFIITNITMYIFLRDVTGVQAILSYIVWMCAGVLYGAIALIYESNLKKSLAATIHYVLNLLLSLGAFTLMYEVILKKEIEFSLLWPVAIFTLVYVLVSICNYAYEKISINALNKKLQEK